MATPDRPDDRAGGDAAANDASAEPLARRLTLVGIWAVAVNGTVGAGIFGTPSAVAAAAPGLGPWVFLLCGALLTPVVLAFAEVSSAFRATGGPVRYTEAAFGPFVGFQVGWAFWVTRVAASAANTSLVVATLGWFWPGADSGAVRLALLAAVAGLLTWVNVAGTAQAMRAIGVLTLLKFLPLLALLVAGAVVLDAAVWRPAVPTVPSIDDLGAAVMVAVYAFVGWESALVPAGEARDPVRDMPRALLLTLATVTALYVAVQAVSVAALPDLATVGPRPLVAVGEVLLGASGAVLLTLGIVLSVAGNVASAALSTPRITYALGRDGLLPAWFARVHPRRGTPAVSIVVYGVAFFALAASGTFVELASISVLARLAIYLAVVAVLPRLRRSHPGPQRFVLPGGLTIPALAALVVIALVLQVDGATVVRTAICLAVGSALYVLARRRGGAPPLKACNSFRVPGSDACWRPPSRPRSSV